MLIEVGLRYDGEGKTRLGSGFFSWATLSFFLVPVKSFSNRSSLLAIILGIRLDIPGIIGKISWVMCKSNNRGMLYTWLSLDDQLHSMEYQ